MGQKISCENTSATDFQLLAPEIIQQNKSDGPSFLDLHLGYELLHISTKYICYTVYPDLLDMWKDLPFACFFCLLISTQILDKRSRSYGICSQSGLTQTLSNSSSECPTRYPDIRPRWWFFDAQVIVWFASKHSDAPRCSVVRCLVLMKIKDIQSFFLGPVGGGVQWFKCTWSTRTLRETKINRKRYKRFQKGQH